MNKKSLEKPIVSVGILTYNHAKYIAECLENVFSQQGDFIMNVIICDDASQDDTVETMKKKISELNSSAMISVNLIENPVNLGLAQNFKKLIYMLGEGEYFTFCEGDDYWSDNSRIQTHIGVLNENLDCALSFNANCVLDQSTGSISNNANHEELAAGKLSSEELIFTQSIYNPIGNLSVGFYRSKFLNDLNPKLFEIPNCIEWMFNLAYSEFGKAYYIKKQMNVYRRHSDALWSSKKVYETLFDTQKILTDYNRFTQYSYDDKFDEVSELISRNVQNQQDYDHTQRYTLTQQNNELAQQNNGLSQQNNALIHQNSDITRHFDALTQQNSDLIHQNSSLVQQNSELTQHTNGLSQKNSELMQQNSKLTQHTNGLSQKNSELTQHIGDLLQHINNLTQHNNDLTLHVGNLTQQKNALVSSVSYRVSQKLMSNFLFKGFYSVSKKVYKALRPTRSKKVKKVKGKKMKQMSGQIIPIMHCFDNNYVIPAAVSFHSMLKHANPEFVYKLYVLHSDITWQNQQKLSKLVESFPQASLEFVDMSHRFNDIWNEMNTSHLAKEVLYKLVAPSIFEKYDKIIVTDVDVVFEGDISPSFFGFSASDKIYLAGVKHIHPIGASLLDDYYCLYESEFGPGALDELKICGGFLVLNLRRLRDDRMEELFLEYLANNAHRLLQAEQDVFNFCLESRSIYKLPLNYVLCSYTYDLFATDESYSTDRYYTSDEIKNAMQNPIQLHYATGTKPWNAPDSTMADKWFSVLKETDFYEDYTQKKQSLGRFPMKPTLLWPDYTDPDCPVMVSVLCCTYNHIKFIEKTLEYLVKQKTEYSFEIIISDDASIDGTQEIIKMFRDKYPHLFKKCVLRDKNVGIGQNYYEALQMVEGKYLAICDGDDYWISPNKLQLQVDILEKNPDLSMTCSSFVKHHVDSDEEDVIFDANHYIKSKKTLQEVYGLKDLLQYRFIASCTVMMRWMLHKRVPEFVKNYNIIDFQLTLIHVAFGEIFVHKDILSQYNSSEDGLFLSDTSAMADESLNIIREINQYLKFNFNEDITTYLNAK